MVRSLCTITILLLTFSTAIAEMYQWVDEKGVVTFSDTPPPVSKKSRKAAKVKIYNDSDSTPTPARQTEPAARTVKMADAPPQPPTTAKKERFSGTVEIYVTEWCGYCKQAQRYMKNNGISYVAYDIEKDSAANKRHKELGGRGVPLIIIGPNKMSGFSSETLEYYLNNTR